MSDVEKPEPETSTVLPTAANVRLNVTLGVVAAVIVKLAAAESLLGLPTTAIVYVPVSPLATVNAPVNVPLETEHV